ncbi:ribonuclease domain-containing protein [Amycolatopsis suaedae]|uniref:Ribonuclease n=1 Tax=Amycolatopsis suaedae TaxID=2510978 RepID=A0A4Q7JDM3_9PSEU|nr:ribonuclease domain-containing protein [Amycolatopsis suaedae]RZQ64743.1 ribonuclease [Amycolatopsis suaedae]
MTNYRSRITAILVAFVVALLGGFGAGVSAAEPAGPAGVQADCGDTSGFRKTPLSQLPSQATDTYNLIRKGGPYPYPQDDTVFQNRERLLPLCASGYYREYTVKTPGSPDRGARRIVKGKGNEFFYTRDHYRSFVLITF